MRALARLCLATVACLPLLACAGGPRRMSAESSEIPDARAINAQSSRTLFLIIVDGIKSSGRSRAALAYLDQYLKLYPDDPKARLLMADCLIDTQQTAAAAVIYRGLLGGDREAAAEAGLGHVAAQNGDWAQAALRFQQASSVAPANAAYLNDLGYAQLMTAQYPPAVATLLQAKELDPDNSTIRANVILALHLAGRDEEARSLIDAATRSDDRDQEAGLLTLDPTALHTVPQTVASATVTP
jgi:Flp pilus assembly protein TadD